MRDFGVWSLIVSKVVQSFILLILWWFASPVRPRIPPKLHLDILSKLFKYGKFVSAAALIGFTVGNLDNIVLGRLVGAAALGSYALAYTITNLIPTFLSLTLGKVFFPLYASIRTHHDKLQKTFNAAIHSVMILMVPITIWFLTVGPQRLFTIFGNKWSQSTDLIGILGIYGAARAIASAMTTFLAAVGRPDLDFVIQIISLAIPVALILPLLGFGASGIAWAFTGGQVGAAIFGIYKTSGFWTLQIVGRLPGVLIAAGIAFLASAPISELITGRLGTTFEMCSYGIFYIAILITVDSSVRSIFILLLRPRTT